MRHVNERDVEWTDLDRGETAFRRKQLGEAASGEQLGCSLYELPAGKRSWPYHFHTANEEAIYVLSGTGRLRFDAGPADAGDAGDAGDDGDDDESEGGIETARLEEGDYVSLPAGERGGHQVVNDSETPLRYLAVSTMTDPDVTVYPEMETFGVFVGSPPGGRDPRSLAGYYRIDDDVDYWEE